ncbi:type II toxin-antitoxin system HigB family toxin [Acinetobacter bereziniae]|uniref:type II toxin-antitoxin system HigB family toxin n=1 Tax=Acinetobacter bereziniae TaxID=106648 RepID=UPI0018FF3041|nr:type II toxin-antitoxin system HigB family toxin [Acinetobacter bereziniae]MBJ8552660.1 type II toxin-antitoxin system HigB family toxin [Acinetobacter bereziniae]
MKLIGRDKLLTLKNSRDHINFWLRGWSSEILNAHWHKQADVFEQFPKARINSDGCFEFSIADESNLVLCTQIIFSRHVVIIKDVKG